MKTEYTLLPAKVRNAAACKGTKSCQNGGRILLSLCRASLYPVFLCLSWYSEGVRPNSPLKQRVKYLGEENPVA